MRIVSLALICLAFTGCGILGVKPTPAASSTPTPAPQGRTLTSCDQLPDGGGVNCTFSDGAVTHHSTCDKCGH